jgi:hypothetical protein
MGGFILEIISALTAQARESCANFWHLRIIAKAHTWGCSLIKSITETMIVFGKEKILAGSIAVNKIAVIQMENL